MNNSKKINIIEIEQFIKDKEQIKIKTLARSRLTQKM